ncbi:MAG: sigma-54-dependent Fis family transcriptional regulator, partial [Flavobacteriales bacterium]|nr:sigma-54-dependent Fis family transcriptional regulator [Flavobacteriales bacterium]
MAEKKILIIDDDVDICNLLQRYLNSKGFQADTAFRGALGVAKVKDESFDVVLSDFRLPDYDGIDLIKAIKAIRNETQVIVITGYSDVKLAIKSIKSGAFEYVTKPIQPEEILNTINAAIETQSARVEIQSSAPAKSAKPSPSPSKQPSSSGEEFVVGTSATAKKLNENINLIAPTDLSVIILGETGTGKEVAARAIHSRSKRSDKPFVAVDCGALPKELASSELFGHVKGAFTGALTDKKGSFELAHGGTLFLDEIGNLTYENQVKMLRVIQERTFRPVGGTKEIQTDVRIIVATNEDLQAAVSDNSFREDLYYRLNEFKIELTPLRERKTDLMDFAQHFLAQANAQLGKDVSGFSNEVIEKMKDYYWHGNLRELKNVIKRATLLTQGEVVELTALPQEIIHPSFISEPEDESSGAFNG